MKKILEKRKELRKELKDKENKFFDIEKEIEEKFLASKKWLPWNELKNYHDRDVEKITFIIERDNELVTDENIRYEVFDINKNGCFHKSSFSGGVFEINNEGKATIFLHGVENKLKGKYVGFYDLHDFDGLVKETSIEYLIEK